MTKAAIDLLPCPFCGGVAERVDIEDGDNAGGSFVHCTACDASGNVEFGFKENFISNWNRRRSAVLEADALSDKIEDLLAEFGDDPRAALECVSEYLSLRRHSAALSVPAAAVVGEPVAWIAQSRWEQMTAAEPWLTNVVYSEDQAASFPCVPLYAAPSPPDGQTLAERMEKARQERRLEDALRHITLVRDEVSDARFRAFALSTANTALGGASHE